MTTQIPFGADDFAQNPEPRCPCLLLLDVSGSMQGAPIEELNNGLVTFRDELQADPMASKRVEVATITFGPVEVQHEFLSASMYAPTHLTPQGDTPMGAAITQGIELVRQRKELYRQNGIAFFRPWIFLITDGAPTDSWREAANAVHRGEESKAFAFFAVGVQNADLNVLKQIATREPLSLSGLRFRELFVWLSNSMKSVSRSTPGTEVPIVNPTAPGGWAVV